MANLFIREDDGALLVLADLVAIYDDCTIPEVVVEYGRDPDGEPRRLGWSEPSPEAARRLRDLFIAASLPGGAGIVDLRDPYGEVAKADKQARVERDRRGE